MASKQRLEMVASCLYQWARSRAAGWANTGIHSPARSISCAPSTRSLATHPSPADLNTGLQQYGTFTYPSPLHLLQLRHMQSGPELNSMHGSSHTSQPILAAENNTPPSTPSTSKPSIVRKLLNMLPGGIGVQLGFKKRSSPNQQPAPSEDKDTEQSKSGNEREKEHEEAIAAFKKMATMDLDGYKELQQTELTDAGTEPLPETPPVPRWHVDYDMFIDFKRIDYLRKKQHIEIIECLTDEQKAYILEQGKKALRDHKLLQAIATTTRLKGTEYMEMEVKDCLREYFRMVKHGRHISFWLEDLGKVLPNTEEETIAVTDAISQLEARDWLMRKLRYRYPEPTDCELHHVRGWAGGMARCEQTDLPYKFCCGNKPMPVKLLEVYKTAEEEGVPYDSREFKRRLEAVLPANRFTRRPKPLNHRLPPHEKSVGLEGHLKYYRKLLRKDAEPKFEKTIQSFVGSRNRS